MTMLLSMNVYPFDLKFPDQSCVLKMADQAVNSVNPDQIAPVGTVRY